MTRVRVSLRDRRGLAALACLAVVMTAVPLLATKPSEAGVCQGEPPSAQINIPPDPSSPPTVDAGACSTWTLRNTSATGGAPPDRQFGAMAYDAARDEVVLFGGVRFLNPEGSGGGGIVGSLLAKPLGDTWVWDGEVWTRKEPSAGATWPSARFGASMAYDAARRQIVLYGGKETAAGTTGMLSDTWVWDGEAWTKLTPAGVSPPARFHAAMGYDAVRQAVVLFGGRHPGVPPEQANRGDTWTWNGSAWTCSGSWTGSACEPPTPAPSGRPGAAMAWDARNGNVVLFGGGQGVNGMADTWVWTGSAWVNRTPTSPAAPRARTSASLAYYPPAQRVLLFGGNAQTRMEPVVWAWDGAQWAPYPTRGVPPQRARANMAFHEGAQEMVLFGGSPEGGGENESTNAVTLGDTWTLANEPFTSAPRPPNSDADAAVAAVEKAADDTRKHVGSQLSPTPTPAPPVRPPENPDEFGNPGGVYNSTQVRPNPLPDLPPRFGRLGLLPIPEAAHGQARDACHNTPSVIHVDPVERRMYLQYCARHPTDGDDRKGIPHIVEYDLRPSVPTILRDVELLDESGRPPLVDGDGRRLTFVRGDVAPNQVVHDRSRHRLIFLDRNEIDIRWGAIDTRTLRAVPPPAFPGRPLGMVYSPEDDLIYLLGLQGCSRESCAEPIEFQTDDNGVGVPGPLPRLTAVDPVTGAVRWDRVITECGTAGPLDEALEGQGIWASADWTARGAAIYRTKGASRPALYFACAPVSGSQSGNQGPASPAGVVRVGLTGDPRTATTASAQIFPVEFFPVPGQYQGGGAGSQAGWVAFDPASERLALESSAGRAPGVWVFDGRRSAFAGFFVTDAGDYWRTSVDEATGRLYVADMPYGGARIQCPGQPRDGLVTKRVWFGTTDTRLTPTPQGLLTGSAGIYGNIRIDSATQRLLIPVNGMYCPNDVAKRTQVHTRYYWVVRDDAPPPPPDLDIPYDTGTLDRPEGPETSVNFSSGVTGFGASANLVGGQGGLFAWNRNLQTEIRRNGLSQGDRGSAAASLGHADVNNASASASANAMDPDPNTFSEWTSRAQQKWPWDPASCLDGGGGGAAEKQGRGPAGEAVVECNFDAVRSVADSTLGGGIRGQGFNVASTYFRARAWRDAEGARSKATSVATGIELSSPGQGSLAIGRAEAVLETAARGRPGTAHATYDRALHGIVMKDGAGRTVFEGDCVGDERCQRLIDEFNLRFTGKIRMQMPDFEKIETRGGAFASVRKTETEYTNSYLLENNSTWATPALKITFYNDSSDKSRAVLELAGVEGNSIYQITCLYEACALAPPPLQPSEVLGSTTTGESGGTAAVAPDPLRRIFIPGSAPASGLPFVDRAPAIGDLPPYLQIPAQGLRFLIQHPKEAALMASTLLIFAGAWVLVRRRRALAALLAGA